MRFLSNLERKQQEQQKWYTTESTNNGIIEIERRRVQKCIKRSENKIREMRYYEGKGVLLTTICSKNANVSNVGRFLQFCVLIMLYFPIFIKLPYLLYLINNVYLSLVFIFIVSQNTFINYCQRRITDYE